MVRGGDTGLDAAPAPFRALAVRTAPVAGEEADDKAGEEGDGAAAGAATPAARPATAVSAAASAATLPALPDGGVCQETGEEAPFPVLLEGDSAKDVATTVVGSPSSRGGAS